MIKKSFMESSLSAEDKAFEVPLRPKRLDDFVGQEKVRQCLQVSLDAAKQRGDPLGHALFCGPPGLGKTTLAHIVAHERETNIVTTSGPSIDKASDLAGLLTHLQKGDILFIDEIHRLPKVVEEYLYPAMENYHLDLMIDTGPQARSVQVQLNPFTLIGATTKQGLISAPMRSRFVFCFRVDYYPQEILQKILLRTAKILHLDLDATSALEIAKRARGTPRIANNLIRWIRDYAQVKTGNCIDTHVILDALKMLNIDEKGLDELDKKILEVMIDHYAGGPVGLNTIAIALGEDRRTIEEVYEPYLMMLGFIKRGPRGREVTAKGYKHFQKVHGK